MEFYLLSLIGLVYYVVVYLLSLKFKFKMIHGLWLPTLLVLANIGLIIYFNKVETTGWAALGYIATLVISLGILLIYLLSWGVHILIVKNRSKI